MIIKAYRGRAESCRINGLRPFYRHSGGRRPAFIGAKADRTRPNPAGKDFAGRRGRMTTERIWGEGFRLARIGANGIFP